MSRPDLPDHEIASVSMDTEPMARLKVQRQAKQAARFIKGPLPWTWVCAAARCHPRGLELVLIVKMLIDITGNETVLVSNKLATEMGLGRETKRRALVALEAAGLVRVDRKRGRSPMVSFAPGSPGQQ